MKVSVIITSYNKPDYLKRVIHGLLLQTRIPNEIIVADDGSKEETSNLVQLFKKKCTNCKIVHVWQKDKGFRAARIRNLAIKKSKAEYLIFLDGDCIPEKHFVEDHIFFAKKGFFFQGKRILIEKQLSKTFTFKDTLLKRKLFLSLLKGNISNGHHIIRLPFIPVMENTKISGTRTANLGVFKKDLYALNGFNEDFIGWGREDSELVARLYNFGLKRKQHLFKAICFHLWHKENNRNNLEKNDILLEKTLFLGEYKCANGLE
ncbi:MAG: glycosyl transferase family 2 [Desulfobacteraceae bacterium 4572_130]|nr:MAG: glycosyl transferase family 2 [Desulfobacteraceae bacterium 4572_130]